MKQSDAVIFGAVGIVLIGISVVPAQPVYTTPPECGEPGGDAPPDCIYQIVEGRWTSQEASCANACTKLTEPADDCCDGANAPSMGLLKSCGVPSPMDEYKQWSKGVCENGNCKGPFTPPADIGTKVRVQRLLDGVQCTNGSYGCDPM